jgi:hypothetical protein
MGPENGCRHSARQCGDAAIFLLLTLMQIRNQYRGVAIYRNTKENTQRSLVMPVILWLLGVPLVVVVLLMLTHVI